MLNELLSDPLEDLAEKSLFKCFNIMQVFSRKTGILNSLLDSNMILSHNLSYIKSKNIFNEQPQPPSQILYLKEAEIDEGR